MLEPRRRSLCILLALLSFCFLFGLEATQPSEAGQAPSVKEKEPTHKADRTAIQKNTESFIQAFERGDAKAVASHWTAEGEFIDGTGIALRGRANIEKTYKELFETKAKRKVEVEVESIRFPSKDTAIEEGYLTVKVGKAEPTGSRYSVLHVREDGKWQMALVREWPSNGAALRDLSWLIGSWVAKRENSEVHTTYEWMWNKSFIRMKFSIQRDDRTITGFQLIGKDPTSGALRSWTFESEGGFGEAHWSRDGKKWVLDSAGILSDGATLASKILFTPLDADSFVSQVVERSHDGEELPDLPPIKVTRVKKQPD